MQDNSLLLFLENICLEQKVCLEEHSPITHLSVPSHHRDINFVCLSTPLSLNILIFFRRSFCMFDDGASAAKCPENTIRKTTFQTGIT